LVKQRAFIAPRRHVAAAEPVAVEVAVNTMPPAMQRASVAPIEDKGQIDALGRLNPIVVKPISIAPIEIAALN
jgi:hypothetical protein